jgi:hypothetical protein
MRGYKYSFFQSYFMAEEGCPDCGSIEGKNCPTCCSHTHTEKRTIRMGTKGRYLREINICKDCGNFVILQEVDYYMESPPL